MLRYSALELQEHKLSTQIQTRSCDSRCDLMFPISFMAAYIASLLTSWSASSAMAAGCGRG